MTQCRPTIIDEPKYVNKFKKHYPFLQIYISFLAIQIISTTFVGKYQTNHYIYKLT